MNLENFIEETNYGFFGISGFCTVLSIIACMYGLRKLRKVQRLSMWGREGSGRMKLGGQNRAREVEERPMAALAENDRGRHLGETVEGIRRAERMREWQDAYKALRETHKDAKAGAAVGAVGRR
ncbi:hypothetical protein B0A55_13275 [Friedmanniomyces simplex]|uniref:Uncharacterized protein n=1 Tax=Friedmanniomyces simplex TaxID=329884 RepID=A0A4U0VM43_9PEZI|nr:hypothetical protein B0A55_13275 [Friedmanniomyces simplex]